MVIFNSYVKLPEGRIFEFQSDFMGFRDFSRDLMGCNGDMSGIEGISGCFQMWLDIDLMEFIEIYKLQIQYLDVFENRTPLQWLVGPSCVNAYFWWEYHHQ